MVLIINSRPANVTSNLTKKNYFYLRNPILLNLVILWTFSLIIELLDNIILQNIMSVYRFISIVNYYDTCYAHFTLYCVFYWYFKGSNK